MSKNKKKIIFGREILFNKLGQIFLKTRVVIVPTIKFYRFLLSGL